MTDQSARFGLPFILPGQAQKEIFHNEALARIDLLLQSAVEAGPLAEPPANPATGQCWIIAAGATGAWSGRDGDLAGWTSGGWRFVQPQIGTTVWNKVANHCMQWNGVDWGDGTLRASALSIAGEQVVGPRRPAIASPSNGTTIDAEARAAIDAVIAALMSHGLIG